MTLGCIPGPTGVLRRMIHSIFTIELIRRGSREGMMIKVTNVSTHK